MHSMNQGAYTGTAVDNMHSMIPGAYTGTVEGRCLGMLANKSLSEAKKGGKIFRPMVICGTSCAGKTTIVKYLKSEYKDKFDLAISHTTREPREGEENGVDYYFMSKKELEKKIQNGEFIESACVHGNLYGTSVNEVWRILCSGKICLLDVDVQGVKKISEHYKFLNPLYLFIMPPNEAEQERRLRSRFNKTLNQEEEKDARIRLDAACAELNFHKQHYFDAIVVNDELMETKATMKGIVTKWYRELNV